MTTKSSSPGTEARHYLVFAPGTEPLGRATDTCTTEAFGAFAGDPDGWMVLIIRLADPAQVQQPSDLWRRVRIYPAQHTFRSSGNSRFGCSGHAWLLDQDGLDTGEKLTFSAEFKIADGNPGDILGELTL